MKTSAEIAEETKERKKEAIRNYVSCMRRMKKKLKKKIIEKENTENSNRYHVDFNTKISIIAGEIAIGFHTVGYHLPASICDIAAVAGLLETAARQQWGDQSLNAFEKKIKHLVRHVNEVWQYGSTLTRSTQMPPQYNCIPDALYSQIRLSRLAQAKRAQGKTR